MMLLFRVSFVVVLSVFFSFLGGVSVPGTSFGYADNSSPAKHALWGEPPNNSDFLIPQKHSNWDQQRQHPAAWDGQDWDPAQWGSDQRAIDAATDAAIEKLFKSRIFERQYMHHGTIPTLQVGPAFYKLSDLDRRRTLKLLTDRSGVFDQGYAIVKLVDWTTLDIIGVYTPKGMYLN